MSILNKDIKIITGLKQRILDDNFYISIDGSAPTLLSEFEFQNTNHQDEEQINYIGNLVDKIKTLKIGKSIIENYGAGGLTEIKRVNQIKRGDKITNGKGEIMVVHSIFTDNKGELTTVDGDIITAEGDKVGFRTWAAKDILIF